VHLAHSDAGSVAVAAGDAMVVGEYLIRDSFTSWLSAPAAP